MNSPALDVPIRDRKQAALDIAVAAMEEIEHGISVAVARHRARTALDRIAELLREL